MAKVIEGLYYSESHEFVRVEGDYGFVGIELADKAIPRHGYTVLNMEGEPIGEVTTGYHTLSSDKSVCMALIDSQYAKLDTEVQIQIRKKVFPGKVVKKQFYSKNYKK